MKCLMRYEWVKLLRSHLPEGKGILGMWARLASRVAFRKGIASYCGYENEVVPGMWSGGIVGVKSILGVKNRKKAFEILDVLSKLGYIRYTLDIKTKKLTYQITDWVIRYSGKECMNGTVYTTDGYGFLCMPRNITERLIEHNYIFEEADAWLDLWCQSSRSGALLPLSSLRTVRDSFPSYGSSILSLFRAAFSIYFLATAMYICHI